MGILRDRHGRHHGNVYSMREPRPASGAQPFGTR
jgi:hypothetical protein